MTTLSKVTMDEAALAQYPLDVQADCRTILGEIQKEAAVILLENPVPPYELHISFREDSNAMLLDFSGQEFVLHFSSLRSIMIDYELIIGVHGSALRHQEGAQRVEAIDMGRRAMHNEGAEMILRLFSPRLTADMGTARLLFTLIFLLTRRR